MGKEVLIDEETISKRIIQLADQINNDYKGEKLTLVCILKGSLYFYADLSRKINLDTELEFIRVSSYEGENSTGKIDFKLDLDEEVTNKNVIVVEDIVDTGNTLDSLLKHLKKQKPKSLKLCTLLDKKDRRETEVPIDYVGFKIPNYFASTVIIGIIAYLLGGFVGICGVLGAIFSGVLIARIARRNFVLANGDVLGMSNEVGRLFSLLFMAVALYFI